MPRSTYIRLDSSLWATHGGQLSVVRGSAGKGSGFRFAGTEVPFGVRGLEILRVRSAEASWVVEGLAGQSIEEGRVAGLLAIRSCFVGGVVRTTGFGA